MAPCVRTVRSLLAGLAGTSAGKGILSMADQAVVSATSFLTCVIVARSTSQEEMGVYYLALTLLLFAGSCQLQTIVGPYSVYCHRRQGRESALYSGSILVHQLILSGVAALAVGVFAVVLSLGAGPRALVPVAWLLFAAMPCLLFRQFARFHSICRLNLAGALALDIVHAAVQLGTLAVLALLGWLSVGMTFGMMSVAAAVVCLQWFLAERGRWQIDRRQVEADWRSNWSFARWALAGHLANSVGPFVMPWIVAALCGKGTTGLFGVCVTLAGVANLFVMGLGNYVSPAAARVFTEEGKAALCRVLGCAAAVFVGVVGGMCLLSALVGERLLVLIYGSEYAGGGTVLTISVASVLAISIGRVAGSGLWALDLPRATVAPDVWALVATLAPAVYLVGQHGALGAALAMLGGAVLAAAFKCVRFLQAICSPPTESACPDCA